MTKTNIVQILLDAMDIERQGEAFYQEAAQLVQDSNGKAVFQSIAQDEVSHLRILQAEYDAVVAGQGWIDVAKAQSHKGALKLFPDVRDAAYMIPAGATDEQALMLAMDLEQKGYTLYDSLAKQAEDAQAEALFRFLAKQENDHYVFLQKTHEYLKSNGVWYFDERELPMFDGGV